MDFAINTSMSGMQASMTRMNVAAHDVANVNTDGYAQYNVNQTDMATGGTRIASLSRPENTTPMSNTDLAEETKEQILSKGDMAANAKVFKVKNQMLGELIDLIA